MCPDRTGLTSRPAAAVALCSPSVVVPIRSPNMPLSGGGAGNMESGGGSNIPGSAPAPGSVEEPAVGSVFGFGLYLGKNSFHKSVFHDDVLL